jgi:aspartyl-tRNA(Asn)/glutamyl-tRNA(Gln) amidotransferase subunit B
MVALALTSKIANTNYFFRKNYFYPDMAKNFQISQYDKSGGVPIATGGNVMFYVDNKEKGVAITRIQLEEDPAKLVYPSAIDSSPYTFVDYNRAGIALLEIVSEPCLQSSREARLFLQKLRSILEHLGVTDGGLDGSLRCDANISLGKNRRVEIKNISSFKEVERALNFEIARQKNLLAQGKNVLMETRHWDENKRVTVSLRQKEEEQDYRYFPEPDLVPIVITKEWIREKKGSMPELPDARYTRFIDEYNLPLYDAQVLTGTKALADFFEKSVEAGGDVKTISNWVMTDFLRWLREEDLEISTSRVTPEKLVGMIKLINAGTISGKIGKTVLREMMKTGKTAEDIVLKKGLTQITSESEISRLVDQVFKKHAKAVMDALEDENAIHFLVGQLMKVTKGKADPALTNSVIQGKIAVLKREKMFEGELVS